MDVSPFYCYWVLFWNTTLYGCFELKWVANAANIICVIFAVSLSSQTSIPLGSAAVTQVSDPKENSCVLTYHIQDYIFTPRWGSVLYSLEFAWFLYFCLPVLCSNTSCAPDINESCPGRIRSDINSCFFLFIEYIDDSAVIWWWWMICMVSTWVVWFKERQRFFPPS